MEEEEEEEEEVSLMFSYSTSMAQPSLPCQVRHSPRFGYRGAPESFKFLSWEWGKVACFSYLVSFNNKQGGLENLICRHWGGRLPTNGIYEQSYWVL